MLSGTRFGLRKLLKSSKRNINALNSRFCSCGPVNSHNEWDTLEEVIVGRADGARVPFMNPHVRTKVKPAALADATQAGGQPHDPYIVKKAEEEVAEFVRVLEGEGVKVRRPDPMPWDKLGMFKTPFFEEGGYMTSTPRDSLLVIGDEIIEAPQAWRHRTFELHPYRRLLNEYFKQGGNWTAAPSPTKRDELYIEDFPFEDTAERERMSDTGRFILTEAEVAFDAADAVRIGKDIFICLSLATNRSGIEWLRRHLAPKGYRVHSFQYAGITNLHADVSLIPLRPGTVLVNKYLPITKINDTRQSHEWFEKRGWEVIVAPESVFYENRDNGWYVSKNVYVNTLSLDSERVVMQKGETLLQQELEKRGFKPILVDLSHAVHLGGAFHCWTVDIKRKSKLESYFD